MQLKKVPLSLLLILAIHCCYSQVKDFGIKGGPSVTTITGGSGIDGHIELKFGYHFGAFGRIKMGDYWAFQPEILFSNQGYESDGVRYTFNYICLPLIFKYQYKKFFFDGGPQLALLVNAKRVDLGDKKNKVNITGQANNFDVLLASGIGFMASKNLGLEARYSVGFISAAKDPGTDANNNVVQISVFYIFK